MGSAKDFATGIVTIIHSFLINLVVRPQFAAGYFTPVWLPPDPEVGAGARDSPSSRVLVRQRVISCRPCFCVQVLITSLHRVGGPVIRGYFTPPTDSMKTAACRALRLTLAADRPAFGVWVTLESPAVTEIVVALGLDWVVIDAEHGHLDWKEIAEHVRATVRS